jgi:hypothetical protein
MGSGDDVFERGERKGIMHVPADAVGRRAEPRFRSEEAIAP